MIESKLLKAMGGYIDGQWCRANAARTQPVVNPATGEIIATVPIMGREETTLAVDAAARALSIPASIDQRRNWLNHLADLVSQNREELGRIITHEHGKPWKEAQGEADYAASFFRYYAGCVDHLQPTQLSERPRGHRWTVHYRPAGVAALITPWNFPLAIFIGQIAAPLAAGNCVLAKPAHQSLKPR